MPLLALLVVLELLLGINVLVIDVESLVLEVLLDLEGCFEIDWRLRVAVANDSLASLVEPTVVCGHPVVLGEFARSLVE